MQMKIKINVAISNLGKRPLSVSTSGWAIFTTGGKAVAKRSRLSGLH